MKTALVMQKLAKHYRAGPRGNLRLVRALDGITLSARRGEVVGVTGPGGSGKSTLLLCAAGLVRADAGSVSWFGERILPPAIPPGIAHVPQRSCYYSFLTVREALEYYATLHDLGTGDRARQVDAVVHEMALADHATRRVGCLAPGLLQRLGLAQALIGAPRALLLDETLDGELAESAEIRSVLRRLSESGTAILIAAAEPSRVTSIAHRIVRLCAGRIVDGIETAGFAIAPPSRAGKTASLVS